ncbi:MAG: grasp-with-spasm system ATP-grasp peptide maturase [Taibaiella sp.]|jgi:ATP-GRASP peptide maturase of grasp-with-spasm system
MVLLLSSEEFETSTDEVYSWLEHLNVSCFRLNGEDFINSAFSITLESTNQDIKTILPDKAISVIWNRRWTSFSFLNALDGYELNAKNIEQIKQHLKSEFSTLREYFFRSLPENSWIDDYKHVRVNKLLVLEKANQFGLKIPATIVTNSKEKLRVFIREHKEIITKTIAEVHSFNDDGKLYVMGTTQLKEKDWDEKVPDLFFPSLFQQLISKAIDIRVFYLDGKFYAMAIFSQRRKEAQIDFRAYDFENPDRMVPFKLPDLVETQLLNLINDLQMTHCSIDMVKDKSGYFYFIEINPVGQFGMVSKPCNYYLEREVALYLLKRSKEKSYEIFKK